MGSLNVILQRMNREIFEKPVELMENVIGVTEHLKKKIVEMGGDPERETLNLIPAKNGKKYVDRFPGRIPGDHTFILQMLPAMTRWKNLKTFMKVL